MSAVIRLKLVLCVNLFLHEVFMGLSSLYNLVVLEHNLEELLTNTMINRTLQSGTILETKL